ncbi:MAG: histidine phosphatase family protein [Pseudomonadales bacterium]|jgi:probable phosphoglycerate mutase|nr:histidine phosphatase family protein [Pseudomonadales bacterium]MDP6472710.1 histidine phosphatase family protein [Pseudomonadales bacterium]MDP6827921.1 histidine phosphatase family protein [Pseudomonadales bacterium]MDP6973495.1 histidine phosphatase family protein [Pseudomonadales bacterium]|tara:strand:+ start:1140 stop:1877 length:738 start_codon:yes stop_codon:yes gene_type:complete
MFKMPDRRRIYLLRHAEAAYVADDGTVTDDPNNVALTRAGRVQARKQSAILANVEFDRAVCSGLRRTVETATIVLAGRETPLLEQQPDLIEIQGGSQLPEDEDHGMANWLRHMVNPWADATEPDARFLGGELFADFEARVTPAFDAIVADTSWNTLLLVAHGGVNSLIFNHILHLPWQGDVAIEQDNACINIIDVDCDEPGGAVRHLIRAVNLTGYNLNKSGIVLTNMESSVLRISEILGDGEER